MVSGGPAVTVLPFTGETAPQPPDLPASLFELPRRLTHWQEGEGDDEGTLLEEPTELGQTLIDLYAAIVGRLQFESQHVPMTTLQTLLLERIAFNYVALRWKEGTAGFDHDRSQKDFNTFWLDMTREFNRQVTLHGPEAQKALIAQFIGIVSNALDNLPADLAQQVREDMATGLEAVGL